MNTKHWPRLIFGVTVLAVSLMTGAVTQAQIAHEGSSVAFGPFPSLPSPIPLPPRLDPKDTTGL